MEFIRMIDVASIATQPASQAHPAGGAETTTTREKPNPQYFLWLLRCGYDCNSKQYDYKQDW